MTEIKASSLTVFNSPRTNKASGTQSRTSLRKDVVNEDEIRTFEFEGCSSGNFGVSLENKATGSSNRTRSALGNIRIAEISSDGSAKQDGRLSVGDRVLEINGHDLSRASLERARWYLGSALRSGKLKILVVQNTVEDKNAALTNGVESPIEKIPQALKPSTKVQKNVVKKIHILKDGRGLGVQISMKLNHVTGEKGVFVSDVSPGGAAERDGRLKEGDELLWINGHSLIGVTQLEAVDLLRASPKLIQLVISTQGEMPSGGKKLTSRARSGSQENVHTNSRTTKTGQLTKQHRAASTDSLISKSRKKSLDQITTRNPNKPLAISGNGSKDVTPKQRQGSDPFRKEDHILDMENVKKLKEMQEEPRKKQNNFLLNGSASNMANGQRRLSSTSSESSNGGSKFNSEDVLLSDSEPVTLEDKPLSKLPANGSSPKASSSPVVQSVKKRNIPSPLLNIPKGEAGSNKTGLAPGQISPSLPRPQKPGGLGIAFPARYLGEASPQMTTVGVPTPVNVIGNNDRDSPQAKRKVSNDAAHSKSSSKGIEEEVMTIVLVKGMSGKGLGFTIVGGKGSPHGDMAVYVKSILPGGAAEADGRMRRGDELLSVNGTSFESFTHQQALDTFKTIRRGIVTLKVRRNSTGAPSLSTFTTPRSSPGSSRRNSKDVTAESSSSSNSSSPTMFRKLRQRRNKKEKSIELVLYKEPGSSLGIGLRGSNPVSQQQGNFVQCILEDSPAANDGRLRSGDQLIEINDQKLEGLTVERVYEILDKTPPGKVYIKVLQGDISEKLPLQLNDALSKLQSERQILDKKMANKPKGTGMASRLSVSSGDSGENITNLSSSCEPLIPLSAEPNKKSKEKKQATDLDDDVFTDETDNDEYVEDIYTVIKPVTGGLGMGVTIDKSRGNTIAEYVSIKTVTEGGAAALATSPRGVGLKLGDQIIEVNGTYLRGMDQEDVIKIFKDLPSTTQMKIRRSRKVPEQAPSTKVPERKKETSPKNPPHEPTPLPKPPENKRRSSLRNKGQSVKPELQEEKPVTPDVQNNIINSQIEGKPVKQEMQNGKLGKQEIPDRKTAQQEMNNGERLYTAKVDGVSSSKHPNVKPEDDSRKKGSLSQELKRKEIRTIQETKMNSDVPSSARNTSNTNPDVTHTKSVKLTNELGDNLIIPSGFRKITVSIRKGSNSTLGISLVPSYGKLKGYFQIRRLLSGMVCAQDGQLHIGDRLVSVNGVSLKGITHSMALQLLKKPMEIVTFVILREGLAKDEEITTASTNTKKDSTIQASTNTQVKSRFLESKDSPSANSSLLSPVSFESQRDEFLLNSVPSHNSNVTERQERIQMDNLQELHDVSYSDASSETGQNRESANKSDEIELGSDEDETVLGNPPALPCSPPPPPLLDGDEFLDQHFSTSSPVPPFSPPPPPPEGDIVQCEDELQMSSIRVVSPPPELSPRMKELIEQDLFSTEVYQETSDVESTRNDEAFLDTSSFVNQTDVLGLNMETKDDTLTSEHALITESPLSSTNLLASPSSTLPLFESEKDKQPAINGIATPSHVVGVDNDLSLGHSVNTAPISGRDTRDKKWEERHPGEDITSSVLPFDVEDAERADTVKPVEGRRVENVPFVITYQRKFRGLGVKVDLSGERKVLVTEVSSFGMVGRDGNIRVGDVLLSIGDTPLEGLDIEVVQSIIKNCPRGDVRIVARAGQKSRSDADEDFVGDDEVSISKLKVEQEYQPDSLLDNTFLKTQVELPRELVLQETPHLGSKIFSNVASSRSTDETLTHGSTPRRNMEVVEAQDSESAVENSDLEVSEFDDLPPSVPPPPVPVNDMQLEGSSLIVDEPVLDNDVEDISLRPPSFFNDAFVDNQGVNLPVLDDSEDEDAQLRSTQAPPVSPVVSEPVNKLSSPVNKEPFHVAELSPRFQQQPVMPPEETQPQVPVSSPSLFGDDTESTLGASPSKPEQTALYDDAPEDGEPIITIRPPSLFNDDLESLPPKPPSLFDDDLQSLPGSSRTPSPLRVESQCSVNCEVDTVSSNSSATSQSPWFKRKSPKQARKVKQLNITLSGSELRSSSPSFSGTVSAVDVDDQRSGESIEPEDVQDDDMASLPPAPPPPRSPVNRSASWSVRASETKPHGHHEMPYISSPLPAPTKPERKNSKKRILPLRIRSKKGRKSSDEADQHGDDHKNALTQSVQVGFDDNSQSVTHVEPPEDDMESLPPAPPPPRMSPLTVQSLENFVDGFQPTNVTEQKRLLSQLEDQSAGISTDRAVSRSSPSPKKKKSFRKHFVQTDAKESFSESSNQSSVPSVPDVKAAVDISVKQLSPQEDAAVTESSDAMSPPPLPPEMELWSEAGSAEAELALLDQILSLEDSSRSGNEQSSEGGSPNSSKRAPLSEIVPEESPTREVQDAPTISKFQEANNEREPLENTFVAGTVTASPPVHTDLPEGSLPESDVADSSDSAAVAVDSSSSLANENSRQGVPGRLSKQQSEDRDSVKVIKHRRPAPPVPTAPRAQNKTGSVSRKPFPPGLGVEVLPSMPHINPKAAPSSQQPVPSHQKEQKITSPSKEKKKLFSKSHKNKQKQPDYLESPDTSFDEKPAGRERSRSWTQKLFGFRSRSKSRDKVKERGDRGRQGDRSRSVSPPRGLFSKSKRSSLPRSTPPLPPPSVKKVSAMKGEVQNELGEDGSEHYETVEKRGRALHPQTSLELNNHPLPSEENNNKSEMSAEDDSVRHTEDDHVANAEVYIYDVVSREPTESYQTEGENHRFAQEENALYDSEKQTTGFAVECEVEADPSVNSDLDTSKPTKPLPIPPVRTRDETSRVNEDEKDNVADELPKKLTSKPPVPRKPLLFKLDSKPDNQQQRTLEELKQNFNAPSSDAEGIEGAPNTSEKLGFEIHDLEIQGPLNSNENPPSPGPPKFKPVPPPLVLHGNANLRQMDDRKPACPNSPGPPKFKPVPPPLSLKTNTMSSAERNDEVSSYLNSPGPPRFKPQPPPLYLKNDTKDRPSLPDQPHFKPLPPLPVSAAVSPSLDDDNKIRETVGQDIPVENNEVLGLQIVTKRQMKPLPPVPTGFALKTEDNKDASKLSLSRQDAQDEYDTEDDIKLGTSQYQSEFSQTDYKEENANFQIEEPLIAQHLSDPLKASNSDDLESSDFSSEWDETCSSTQEDHGLPMHGIKVARSASFSPGDHHIEQEMFLDNPKTPASVSFKRPPPPMRRRSSSLPQLFLDLDPSKARSDATNYWHTGNLQELINSRNQEPDVDEGIIEVQLLKEQQSIGLMVVGGLDTHLGMLYIKDITPNSPAANCNRLRIGDQLLQVNDQCLVGVTHGEALNILKNTPPLVKLTLARKQNSDNNVLELEAERRRISDFEEPIVNQARQSSTVSKTSQELSFSPPPERGQRPKSVISMSSFGSPLSDDLSPTASLYGSFDEPEEYVPAYLERESPTLNLRQDDVPVTVIDGIPGEDSDATEEEEPKSVSKSVSWAVSDAQSEVFTVEILKNGRVGLGMSVSGGVDTPYDDIMVRQILSNSVTAQNGLIKKGDILLSVNGKSFKGLTNTEALTLLKNTTDRVTLVVCRPVGSKHHGRLAANREIFSDSDAWPTKEEMTKKKNLANTTNSTLPTLEKIPLDLTKQNGESSTYDRLKKRLFSNGGSKSLKERLQKAPQGPYVTEITLEKGASGLGFSLGGGQDSLYGDAPIHVRYVFKDSVAGRSGKLKPGDEILEVNGQRVAYMTSVDALELIRRLPYGPVVMKIRRK